ncbi:MAG: GNAT family N-acetyltransferase [Saprospiraceae bacterium]|nr:GNAT family N-acetyltransferase [Saprospiraceae bacterium]
MINLQFLDWDSNFFGFPIGQILINKKTDYTSGLLSNLLVKARDKNIKLVYLILPERDSFISIPKFENNIRLVDKKVYYQTEIVLNHTQDKHISSYKANTINNDMYELALSSGEYSRFKVDPDFPDEECKNLFKKWIENSINKTYADEVLVYQSKNKILGMVTLSIKKNSGNIGLIAVNKQYQGQYIGHKLINASKHYFKQKGIKDLTVTTQSNNFNACRFYEKNDFYIKKINHIYHCWL